jgi:hypothetical protein
MTWRKLGYAFFSDSSRYREVLKQNPGWNVMENPPIGTTLNKPLETSNTTSGGLSSQPSVFSFDSENGPQNYYPFPSKQEYFDSVVRYSSASLYVIHKVNGLSIDSEELIG